MQRVLDVLKSRYFLSAVGAVLLAVLIWYGGSWLGLSVAWRLAGIIAVLLVCIAALVWSVVRANRAAASIEQSLREQAESQRTSARPDRREEIEQLEKRLGTAIDTLKNSKLGQGRRGKAALYALPWYMMVGPPGSGKTTAVTESGLNFPMGADRVRGVGGTRDCDWFFSDQAILLDTAGRYMTEEEDTEEWNAFLDMLKEQRPARPVNGIIVGISVAELAGASREDVEWHAGRIRRRIDQLIERLGVRFPVYLMFTKCDLLTGFVEFFEDFPRRGRQQVWGHTWEEPLADEQQHDARQDEGEADDAPRDVRSRFEHAFEPLVDALVDRRGKRLRRSMKRERRRKVYAFPLEFASVQEPLAHFVSQLFQPNPYQESPIFRGFYFTSGTQEGAPLDRVIQAVGQQFDLPAEQSAPDPEIERKSYFLKDLFTDVVIADQYLVRQTSEMAWRGWLRRAGVTAAAVVALVLFTLGASQALVRSRLHLGDVREAAAGVQALDFSRLHAARASGVLGGGGPPGGAAEGAASSSDAASEEAADVPEAFARMERLREEVQRLERYEEDPPLLRWGLSRGGRVLGPARTLYTRQARAFLYNYPFETIRERLGRAAPGGRSGPRQARYDDLRAYLLMTGQTDRLGEEAERQFLKDHLTGIVDSTLLRGRAASADGQQRDALRRQLRRQVDAAVDGLSEGRAQPFQGDAGLVSSVRNQIYREPSVSNLYRRIKEKGRAQLPAFSLADAVPRRDVRLFATTPDVPGLFTKAGWKNFVKDAITRESEGSSRGDWVIGHTAEDLPQAMQDSDALATTLRERYFGEYASHWKRFLRSADLARFGDVSSALRAMTRLASQTDSPLLYLLARATRETTFENQLADQAQEQAQEAAERAANRQARRLTRTPDAGLGDEDEKDADMHPVDRRFSALHALNADQAASGGASSSLYAAMDELARMRRTLENMGSGSRAAEYAAQVFADDGGEVEQSLESLQSALGRLEPPVRRTLFDQPLLYAWGAVVGEAQSAVNEQWREAVHRPFQTRLSGLYPFDVSSTRGAPLQDFTRFFHPDEGTLATFLDEHLAAFLTDDLQPRTFENRGLRLSPAARQALLQARRISQGLFENGVLGLTFEMQPELPDRSGDAPAVDQVFVAVNGKENVYRMGSYRPWKTFTWPGRAGVTLSVSTRSGDLPPKRFEGPWAWFRLLQQARVQRTAPSVYEVQWLFEQQGQYTIATRYNLRTQASASPLGNVRNFFSVGLPASLN